MDFTNKRAVVTGAASGIGRAIAQELATRGTRVLAADVDEAGLAQTRALLGEAGEAMRCDVSDHAQVEALGERAADRFGGVDLAFANAGVIAGGNLLSMSPAEVDWILGVNVRGVWSTASVFGRMMLSQPEGGRLCITGSEHSLGFQHGGAGIYTASKHAVLGMADVLRAELPATVTVSVFCPGLVGTALGSGPRPRHLPPVRGNPELSAKIQSRGMSAQDVAARAVDGVARGDFLIVTHPHAIRAAERRYEEIGSAFAAQAPWREGAERYDVNRVLAEVMAEISAKEV